LTPPNQPSWQKDLFGTEQSGVGQSLVLEIIGIQVPPGRDARERAKQTGKPPAPNYHTPSKKNNKLLVTKGPNGRPLRKPFLRTKPEYLEWTEKALQHLESTLLSACQTGADATQQVRLKLCATLSLLFEDDSVNDLTAGSWKVEFVDKPELAGAVVTITRLT